MVKAKPLPFGTAVGYSTWNVRRTIREAENVARWNPWKAHEWFEEARERINIDTAPFFEEYDAAARRVNAYWISLQNKRYYDMREFWKKDKTFIPPKLIETILD